MNKTCVAAAVFFCLLVNLSCSKSSEPVVKVGEWKFPGYHEIVVIYHINDRGISEDALRQKLVPIARDLLQANSPVLVFAFFDKSFARKLASKETQERAMSGSSVVLNKWTLSDPGMKTEGGAFVKVSKEKPDEEWSFSPAKEK